MEGYLVTPGGPQLLKVSDDLEMSRQGELIFNSKSKNFAVKNANALEL